MWSALGTHFGVKKAKGDKIPAYKHIPEGARLECLSLIARLSVDNLVTLTRTELDTLIAEKLKALPAPAPLAGDVMPKQQHNSVTVTLTPLENRKPKRWLFTQACGELVVMMSLDDDKEVMDREGFIRELRHDNHIVAERTAHGVRSMVMDFLPIQLIPVILEASTTRMQRCNW